MKKKILFSVVVPIYNEEGSIKQLIFKIFQVFNEMNQKVEIIVVDDGSTDNSRNILNSNKHIKTIFLKKNYGQSLAIDAGLRYASGDFLVTIDGDGQNDPFDIPKMFNFLKENNFDMVCGWRKHRKDKKTKKIGAFLGYFLRKKILDDGLHDSGCTLKIFKKKAYKKLFLFNGMHRFIPALLQIKNMKISEIEVNHLPRRTGKTKYNGWRFLKAAADFLCIYIIKKTKENKFKSFLLFILLFILFVLLVFLFFKFNLMFFIINSLTVIFYFFVFLSLVNYYFLKPRYKIEKNINNYSVS